MGIESMVEGLAGDSNSIFKPIRVDYADFEIDVADSFNWPGIFKQVKELNPDIDNKVALFVFRSIRRARADDAVLEQLDEAALISAKDAKGFIHYEPFEGLSYCLWRTPEDARAAISSPEHVAAACHAVEAYVECHLVRGWLKQSPIDGKVELIKA